MRMVQMPVMGPHVMSEANEQPPLQPHDILGGRYGTQRVRLRTTCG